MSLIQFGEERAYDEGRMEKSSLLDFLLSLLLLTVLPFATPLTSAACRFERVIERVEGQESKNVLERTVTCLPHSNFTVFLCPLARGLVPTLDGVHCTD